MRDVTDVCFIRYRRKSVVVKTNSLQKRIGDIRECWRGQRMLARSESVGEVRECWRGQRMLARPQRVDKDIQCWLIQSVHEFIQ